MRSIELVTAGSLLLLVSACSSGDGASAARVGVVDLGTSPRIVGGTPSTTAQDATVLILMNEGFCTGTLIAPNLVLTARHCVSQMAGNDECQHFTTDDDPTQMGVVLGRTASMSSTPVAYGKALYHEKNPSGCSYDIALIQLDHDLAGATIATVRTTPPTTSDVGTAVGYGDADDRGDITNGRYQRGSLAVFAYGGTAGGSYTYKTKSGQSIPVDVSPGEIITGESTCFGDSGGPLFDASGAIIGVTSRGVDQYCVDRPTVWSDVYSHLTMIDNAATSAGHPLTPAGSSSSSSSSSSGSSGSTSSSGGPTPNGTSSGGISKSDPPASSSPKAGDDTSPPGDATATSSSSGCSASRSPTSPNVTLLALTAALVAFRRRRVGVSPLRTGRK